MQRLVCLCLSSDGIKGVHHQGYIEQKFLAFLVMKLQACTNTLDLSSYVNPLHCGNWGERMGSHYAAQTGLSFKSSLHLSLSQDSNKF